MGWTEEMNLRPLGGVWIQICISMYGCECEYLILGSFDFVRVKSNFDARSSFRLPSLHQIFPIDQGNAPKHLFFLFPFSHHLIITKQNQPEPKPFLPFLNPNRTKPYLHLILKNDPRSIRLNIT